jgi:hypothetical protein
VRTLNDTALSRINIEMVCDHYAMRLATSQKLRNLFKKGDVNGYAKLALGVSENTGNYSAAEHKLGPRVLSNTTNQAVFDLATKLNHCTTPSGILDAIYKAKLPYLKISVGSEMAMMLQPQKFWVANVRSVWAHLLVKHKFSYARANEELHLYRDENRNSEMDYQIWKGIYSNMEGDLARLGELGNKEAKNKGKSPGETPFLWYDAIANELYAQEHE